MLFCRDLQVFDRPQGRLAGIQPVGKPGAVHDGDAGAVLRPKFCCVIGVAQKPAVIGQDEGGGHVQKLLQLQVVIVPYPLEGQIFAIHMGEADNTVTQARHGMALGKLGQRRCERVE